MGLRQSIVDSTQTLLENAMLSFDNMANQSCSILSGGIDDTLWDSAISFSDVITPFCEIIIGICILLELARTASKIDMIKWEHGLRCGVKMCIAKVCMEKSPIFLRACYNQASLFIAAMGGSATVSLAGTVTPLIKEACKDVDDLGGAIGLLCSTLVLQMGIKLCGLLILVMSYGRVFEILMLVVISPIPVAFSCYNEGNSGLGRMTLKFAKSFIAVCLSGVMMYGCIALFGAIISTKFADLVAESVSSSSGAALVSDLCYDMILFTIVLCMAVSKCGSWAKSAMDAG